MPYARVKGHVVKRNRNQTDKTVAELLADALATIQYAKTIIPDPVHDDLAAHFDGQAEEILNETVGLRSILLTWPRRD